MWPRLLVAALLAVSAAVAAAPEKTLKYRINGLDEATEANVRAHLGPEPKTEYERNSFLFSARENINNGLNALGYYHADIQLDLKREPPQWQLAIDIQPGERVALSAVDVRVSGDAAADEAFDAMLADIPLKVGQPLNHDDYENFKTALLTLGRERGYVDAEMTRHRVSVNMDTAEARVELFYDSGERYRFGAVTFDEFPLDQRRLDQLMTFAEGDPVDVAALQAFQTDLQRTEYFGSALVQPLAPDRDNRTLPVHVALEPGKRHHFRAGVGYSTDTQARISLSWRTPLINSKGHRQNTLLEYSPVRPRLNVTYGIPLSHPLDDTLALSGRLETNEYGSLDSFQRELGVRREFLLGDWVTAAGIRRLWENWDVGPSNRDNEYLLPGVSFAHTLARGDPVDPEAGFSQWYIAEFGADQAGSDLTLLRLYANWKAVFRLSEKHRLVGRAELGAVQFSDDQRPDLAPSLSFFAGGSRSIRGYAYQSLGPTETVDIPGVGEKEFVVGGDRLTVVSAEYQYYVWPEFRAALFVDTGNAFNWGDFDPVTGAGIGLHYMSPVGAIRLDIANNVSESDSKWRIHFNIGAEF